MSVMHCPVFKRNDRMSALYVMSRSHSYTLSLESMTIHSYYRVGIIRTKKDEFVEQEPLY